MNQVQPKIPDIESITWGAIFIWWGIVQLIPAFPKGAGAVGIGLILLGVNAFRAWQRLPTSGFSIGLGILMLVLGGLDFANANLPFELPGFAILLIVLGSYILIRQWTQSHAH